MGLISTTIPNLINGVSQQPDNIRMTSQCAVMENCFPSVVEFLKRRPASRHIARVLKGVAKSAAVHVINRDSTEQYIVIILDNTLKVFDLKGNEKTVKFPSGSAYLKSADHGADIKCMTINDYTFVLNSSVTALASTSLSGTRADEALVFIKQASYATEYMVELDGVTYKHTTYKDDNRDTKGVEYNKANGYGEDVSSETKDAKRYKLSSVTIANDLAAQIRAGGYQVSVSKSTLWIRRSGSVFTIKGSDSRSNTHILAVKNSVQRFSDLPTVAPNGYMVEVKGDQSSSFDNYFVKFKTDEGQGFSSGVWLETVKSGIKYALNASTMPHSLIREADGTFTFKPLTWGQRKCGDEDSAPDPSFINRKLSAVFFYRNRLGFLANENCILSEAGKFFNFYPTTVTALIDSDPIDVAASHTKASDLYHAVPFSEGLLLFSDQTQFMLEHDDVLSVKTVAVKPVTEFECSPKAAPVGAGKNVFFATHRGQYGGVREYFVETDTALTDAADVTSHVPRYIPGNIYKLIVSSNEDVLIALSANERKSISVYKYFWSAQEKLQSAWGKWTFSGEVLAAAFLDSQLLMVMQYSDGIYLESFHIEPGYLDDGEQFEYALDRKIDEKALSGITFDAESETSKITFPYPLIKTPAVISRTAAGQITGVEYEVLGYSGNVATLRGDVRGLKLFAGLPYISRYVFSKQIVREDTGNNGKLAITDGRLQLRSFTLSYANTGYFKVLVTPEYRKTNERIFPGRVLGHGDNILGKPVLHSGFFKFPVQSNAWTVDITLESDSFLPFQITSAGWEGYFHLRSRRL